MRAGTLLVLIIVVVGAVASSAYLLPLLPSPYPISQVHVVCSSRPLINGCDFPPEPSVYGSVLYHAFGYGGVIMPDHSYLLVTNQTQPPVTTVNGETA